MNKPDLSKFHTKQLLQMLDNSRQCGSDEYEIGFLDEIKAELALREHVMTPAQSKLVRKMSKKAGEKLTLKEAQLLNNKSKK